MANMRMVLCPQCRTIQKDKTTCPLCTYPIDMEEEKYKGEESPERRTQDRRTHESKILGEDFFDKE